MIYPRILLTLVSAAALALGTTAQADTAADLKHIIETNTGGKVVVDSVEPSPAPGIYQVVSGGEIFYTDASGRYGIVGGAMVDMQAKQDLTAPALERLSAVPFDQLPLELAIKEVHGDGSRQMALFEDPNCPICRAFTKFVEQLDDVTVYRFMFPVLDPSSQDYARVAWCAADTAGAWQLAMAGNRITGDQSCDITGLANILKFGEKHRIDATPTVFLGNGKRLVGATPPDQFIAELDASIARQ